MPNPDGTFTRDEHEAAILSRYRANRQAGMNSDEAMTAAGKEWRAEIGRIADKKIAFVKKRLGIRDSV